MAKVKAATLAKDLIACVGVGNTYGTPQCTSLAKLKAGKQKVLCDGFVRAALPSLPGSGTNTIWRSGYLTETGYVSDHKSTNGYNVGKALKSSQLKVGMALFKWQRTGCAKAAHQRDGKGNYCHIGVVVGVNPLRIAHCSSEQGEPIISKSIGKFCAWAYMSGVDYGTTSTASATTSGSSPQKQEDRKMLYQAKVTTSSAPLNVRAQPSAGANRVGQVKRGAVVNVYEVSGKWWRISYGTTIEGWASSDYLRKIAGTEQAIESESATEAVQEPVQEHAGASSQYVLRAEYEALVAAFNALTERVDAIEQDLEVNTDAAE